MGTCYYPEHWDKSLWPSDLERMLAAGITQIRIAEFAWNKVEPEEGRFDFSFFDEFLNLCAEKGMKVIFGTPTATPPAWLTERYPEVLNASKEGILYRHGGRRHYNYNSPVYRKFAARIVEQEAAHYGQHSAIVGWQIDNELNCEMNEFYSEADTAAFRIFLQEKYGTLERLNEAWGTAFWNQTYTDWEQVHLPRPILAEGRNPHQHLDYFRFISDSTLSFCKMQADILRRYKKPGDFIATNGMFGNMDNHRMMRESLDVYTYDSYPNFGFGLGMDPQHSRDLNDRKWSRNLIEVRSICPHFGIMEQQSGANGWTTRMEAPAPRPGQLTLWAMQSVAQGADMVSFFRWRTCTMGTEIYWHGILDYDSRDNRKLAEVKDFYRKLESIDAVCGAQNVAVFALLKDYDNVWDAQVDAWHRRVSWPSEDEVFVASELCHTPHDVVYFQGDEAERCVENEENCLRDTLKESEKCSSGKFEKAAGKNGKKIGTSAALGKYPVVIYPHPTIMTEERAEVLKKYVEDGGTLIIGCRAGYKDITGKCVMLPQPGLLAELTGTDVSDFTFASPAEEPVWAAFVGKKSDSCKETGEKTDGGARVSSADVSLTRSVRSYTFDEKTVSESCDDACEGTKIPMPIFCDILTPLAGTKVLANYGNSYFAGKAAVTEHQYGNGRVIHFGSTFTRESLKEIFAYLGILEPFAEYIDAPEEAEVVLRRKDGRNYLFVLNFSAGEIAYTLKKEAVLLYTGETAIGMCKLLAYGTAVYEIK
ncbi:MAG: beta-galactosidase [Lachnospiraceae bacterium]|nr:beta-galactosidase [Lachnospiraceae bacterium]